MKKLITEKIDHCDKCPYFDRVDSMPVYGACWKERGKLIMDRPQPFPSWCPLTPAGYDNPIVPSDLIAMMKAASPVSCRCIITTGPESPALVMKDWRLVEASGTLELIWQFWIEEECYEIHSDILLGQYWDAVDRTSFIKCHCDMAGREIEDFIEEKSK